MSHLNQAALTEGMAAIQELFRDLVDNGRQAVGLPAGQYAAGQYLNPDSINQRGLFGTSAALLVFSRSSPSPDRTRHIDGILRYLSERNDTERRLARTEDEQSALAARLATEWQTAFKCADLLYALSAAPAAARGREELITKMVTHIDAARRPEGGWAADLNPAGPADVAATAAVTRARNAAGLPADRHDIDLIRKTAHDDGAEVPVRVLCLLVLLELPGDPYGDTPLLQRFLAELKPGERTEVDHDYILANHYHYVRIPWKLYLLCCVARCNPTAFLLNQDVRAVLRDALNALNTPEGYVFTGRGRRRSTRTYAILMDTLWHVRDALGGTRALAAPFRLLRRVSARWLSWAGLALALGIAGVSLWWWLVGEDVPLESVGGELVAAGLLAFLALVLGRIRGR